MSVRMNVGRISADLGVSLVIPSYPMFFAFWVKYTDWANWLRAIGLSSDNTYDNWFAHENTGTAGQGNWIRRVTATGHTSIPPTSMPASASGWVPCFMVSSATDNCTYWTGTASNGGANYTAKTLLDLRYLHIGGAPADTPNNTWQYAEVSFGSFAPSAQDRTDFFNGVSPNTIWSGRTDYHYYRLLASGTQSDASPNGGPNLTINGTVEWFPDDNPAITAGGIPQRHISEIQQLNRGIGPARAAGLEGDLQ